MDKKRIKEEVKRKVEEILKNGGKVREEFLRDLESLDISQLWEKWKFTTVVWEWKGSNVGFNPRECKDILVGKAKGVRKIIDKFFPAKIYYLCPICSGTVGGFDIIIRDFEGEKIVQSISPCCFLELQVPDPINQIEERR